MSRTLCVWDEVEEMASLENEVQIDAQGRVVIPAALRKTLNLKPGDRLIIHREGDRIVLQRGESTERRLWVLTEL